MASTLHWQVGSSIRLGRSTSRLQRSKASMLAASQLSTIRNLFIFLQTQLDVTTVFVNITGCQTAGNRRLTVYASREPLVDDLHPCTCPSNIYAPPDYEMKEARWCFFYTSEALLISSSLHRVECVRGTKSFYSVWEDVAKEYQYHAVCHWWLEMLFWFWFLQ